MHDNMADRKLYIPFLLSVFVVCAAKYDPTWDSLDSRPNPAWYDEAKFGIFMHWGVYSVPGFGSEWFWKRWHDGQPDYVEFMKKNYPPGFSYADFAPMFKAEFFDPNDFADVLSKSGAKYVVFTSKHHEGFTLWRSNVSWNWNAVDTGPHRDIIAALSAAVRNKTDLKFGLYHSLYEWFNPLFLKDQEEGFKTDVYVQEILMPELYDIVNTYKPEYVWSDGPGQAVSDYWKSKAFLAWLYNESPVKDTVVVNDRWGTDCKCKHGGVFTCTDRYNPGHLVKHKWENALTVDRHSWGYRRNMNLEDILSIQELIKQLASTVSCGGNMLLNVGPTSDGRICPIFQERLTQMGEWLQVNGEGIYATKPWRAQNDTVTPGIWYTSKSDAVYAIILNWPSSGVVKLTEPISSQSASVHMLGVSEALPFKPLSDKGGILVDLSKFQVEDLPCQWSWTFKLTGAQ